MTSCHGGPSLRKARIFEDFRFSGGLLESDSAPDFCLLAAIFLFMFSINSSCSQSINQPINQSINQSINQPINQEKEKKVKGEIRESQTTYLCISCWLINPPIHQSFDQSTKAQITKPWSWKMNCDWSPCLPVRPAAIGRAADSRRSSVVLLPSAESSPVQFTHMILYNSCTYTI